MNGTQKINNDKIDALYSLTYHENPELWCPISFVYSATFEINTCRSPMYQQKSIVILAILFHTKTLQRLKYLYKILFTKYPREI